jgi:hypothetical protein
MRTGKTRRGGALTLHEVNYRRGNELVTAGVSLVHVRFASDSEKDTYTQLPDTRTKKYKTTRMDWLHSGAPLMELDRMTTQLERAQRILKGQPLPPQVNVKIS